MFGSIDIKNFRGFKAMAIEGLSRINLFVGANNAGKTSALEAVELLAGGSSASSLEAILIRREEYAMHRRRRENLRFDLHGLFHGREPAVGTSFAIRAEPAVRFTATLAFSDDEPPTPVLSTGDEANWENFEFSEEDLAGIDSDPESMLGLLIETARGQSHLWPGGSKHPSRGIGLRQGRFLGTAPARMMWLTSVWDSVALTEKEDVVIQTLRIIEPRVLRLAAISNQYNVPAFVVQLEGVANRVPLGSMGEGMRRLLALALVISDTPRGGALLIDEIDTGLHHTVLRRMWVMLIEAARRFDFQVFATSHSLDCLMALSRVTTESPELAPDVSVHRFETGASTTVRFSADELATAIQHELEVR